MPSQAWSWRSFFTRMKDVDPDLRQMALFDLQEELKKEAFQLGADEDECMTKIITCFTTDESNSEVHSNAVRVLEVLLPKASAKTRDRLIAHLANNMHCKSDAPGDKIRALRDNASLALKTCVSALTTANADSAKTMAKGLIAGINHEDVKIRTEIFDVLAELEKTFGAALAESHAPVADAAKNDLQSTNAMLRKRSLSCLANVAAACDAQVFDGIMNFTVQGLGNQHGANQRRFVQLVSAISRAAGGRFAQWVERVAPLLFAELKRLENLEDDEEREAPETDDTRENILQALENIIARCPLYVTKILPDVIDAATTLLSWDPNYCDDLEDDDEFEDDDDMMEIEDDDDSSWKVRKSASRCLLTIVKVRPDALDKLIRGLLQGSALIVSRFSERVENVRLEVFDLFRGVLSACRVIHGHQGPSASAGSMTLGSFHQIGEETLRPEADGLKALAEPIVKALVRSAKHKSPKVKQSIFVLLTDLHQALGSQLSSTVEQCVAMTSGCLSDGRLALPHLRPLVLEFARTAVSVMVRVARANQDESIIAALEQLLPSVVKCTDEKYYRTVVGALRVLHAFVEVAPLAANPGSIAQKLFTPLYTRLSATDADQDVRRTAMAGLAALLKEPDTFKPLSAAHSADVKQAIELISNLLCHESTRLAAARAVTQIQRCGLEGAQVEAIATELTSFLRKTDRQVREQGLRTLAGFVPVHARSLSDATLNGIITELVNPNVQLLSDKELFLTVLALKVAQTIVVVPSMSKPALDKLAPAIVELLKSPLVQGTAVTESAAVLGALARTGSAALLFASLQKAAAAAESSALPNVSSAIGTVVEAEADAKRNGLVAEVVKMAQGSDSRTAVAGVSCLGDIGRHVSLSTTGGSRVLEDVMTKGSSEEIKSAAACAYGRASSTEAGEQLLAGLIQSVVAAPDALRLRALRECLLSMKPASGNANGTLNNQRQALFAALVQHTGSENEAVVDSSAECIGRLAHALPTVVGDIKGALEGLPDNQRAAVLSSLRFTMSHAAVPAVGEALRVNLPAFLSFLNGAQPVKVRRAAVQLLAAAAYNRASFIETDAVRNETFPNLLACCVVDKSLIEVIDLGPFKHTVDKGLDLRKQAFECVSVFADSLTRPNGILESTGKLGDVVLQMTTSLKDPETDYECWASARGTLVKLARHSAGAALLVEHAETLLANLKVMVGLKVKEGQENERIEEAIRGAIVATLRIAAAVPSISQHAKFADLMTTCEKNKHFAKAKESMAE